MMGRMKNLRTVGQKVRDAITDDIIGQETCKVKIQPDHWT